MMSRIGFPVPKRAARALSLALFLPLASALQLGAQEPAATKKPFDPAAPLPEIDLSMAAIEPGTFTMTGATIGETAGKATEVTITQPYWIARHEVTQAQWQAVMGVSALEQFAKAEILARDDCGYGANNPIFHVSWDDAVAFCDTLNRVLREAGRLPEGYEFRLPTEAQWEFACRAGRGGDAVDAVEPLAWFSGNSEDRTHRVGQKAANAWGLYDMQGNVSEWCLDWWQDELPGGTVTDWTGPAAGRFHVFRGGAFADEAANCVPGWRFRTAAGDRVFFLGFRVALVGPAKSAR